MLPTKAKLYEGIWSKNILLLPVTTFHYIPPAVKQIKSTFDLVFQDQEVVEAFILFTLKITINKTCLMIKHPDYSSLTMEWCQNKWEKNVEYISPNFAALVCGAVRYISSSNKQMTFVLQSEQYEMKLGNPITMMVKYKAPSTGMLKLYRY